MRHMSGHPGRAEREATLFMHGRTKQLACGLAACVPVIGLLMAFGPAASASTASPARHGSVHLSARQMAQAKAQVEKFFKRNVMDYYGKRPTASPKAGIPGDSKVQSTNWSGWADTGTGFTAASATWTEPTPNCAASPSGSLAAFWVGIDGFSSDSVEQDGTLIECEGSTAVTFSWWEMFPNNDVQIVGESVAAGDKISASVARSGDSYTLKVTDSTHTADSFSKTESCSDCANSSAEFIAEAPTSSGSVTGLTDFGTWKSSNSKVSTSSKSGVISSFTTDQITMVTSSGTVESKPSDLDPAGNQFHCTWES
jgi:hypothetical protein